VLVSAVPPLMLKTEANPGGLPIEVFDGFRKALADNRAQFFLDVPTGPFYGFNRPGAKIDEGVTRNWWRQGMQGGAKAHYDGIKAFSETDQTEDLKAINVPTLVLHGEDDQIVPIGDSALLAIKLLKNGTLKTYAGYSHGMLTVNADVINADLLAFVKNISARAERTACAVRSSPHCAARLRRAHDLPSKSPLPKLNHPLWEDGAVAKVGYIRDIRNSGYWRQSAFGDAGGDSCSSYRCLVFRARFTRCPF
jgi:hypothetical protein